MTMLRAVESVDKEMDSKPIYDILAGAIGYPAVFAAHRLNLFELLDKHSLSIEEVCDEMNIKSRPAEVLLNTNVALELVHSDGARYSLTPLARKYLLQDSPTYFGGLLDLVTDNPFVTSIDSLMQAVLSDTQQAYGNGDIFHAHNNMAEKAASFTRAMHSLSVAPAQVWPGLMDLAHYSCLLDIGGGSGAHAMGAVSKWSQLNAVVFDMEPVCEVANEYISATGLQDRVTTVVGDLWTQAYPQADVHFYSQIFHDWPYDKCLVLAQKSFDSLPQGGRIIIHEMLYDDDKKGPFMAAAASCSMLLWTEGKQYSGKELSELLTEAGFVDVEITPGEAYWNIVTAVKG